jgi:NADH-quinone oxidoreductase subunit J
MVVLVIASVWTVMTRSLLRAGIGLALVSVILAVLMFRLHAVLASVFELSVCAGLISVLFVSVISLTQPYSQQEIVERMKSMFKRFKYLPFIVIVVGLIMFLAKFKFDFILPVLQKETDVRNILWNYRQIDLIGQIIILLCGVFAVVILFKEARKNVR